VEGSIYLLAIPILPFPCSCFRYLTQGRYLLSVWPVVDDKRMGPAPEPGSHPIANHPVLEIVIPVYSPRPRFPPSPVEKADIQGMDLKSLDPNTRQQLLDTSLQGTFSS